MSEKVSLEALLPVAVELLKTVQPVVGSIKPTNTDEQSKQMFAIADRFTEFTLYLHKKINRVE